MKRNLADVLIVQDVDCKKILLKFLAGYIITDILRLAILHFSNEMP